MAMVITGVIGYHALEGYTWLEALYMTVITLSTVGFQEVRPLSAPPRGLWRPGRGDGGGDQAPFRQNDFQPGPG
jgi:hypothetical protein